VVKDFKYRLFNKRKDNLMKWRCTRKMCSATILTKSNYTVLSTINDDHKHEKEDKIELRYLKIVKIIFRPHINLNCYLGFKRKMQAESF